MYTLGIDTSYEVAVGLALDGIPIHRLVVADTRSHAETVLPIAQRLCAQVGIELNDLAQIAVGMGPGPFTGLRVGIVSAQTLAYLLRVKPIGVCSLDVIAAQWERNGAPDEFIVASDARRNELYWARYDQGRRVEGPEVSSPDKVPKLPMAGPVLDLGLGISGTGPRRLDAAILAAVSASLPSVAEPLYLRAADAAVSTRTKSVLPRLKARRIR